MKKMKKQTKTNQNTIKSDNTIHTYLYPWIFCTYKPKYQTHEPIKSEIHLCLYVMELKQENKRTFKKPVFILLIVENF